MWRLIFPVLEAICPDAHAASSCAKTNERASTKSASTYRRPLSAHRFGAGALRSAFTIGAAGTSADTSASSPSPRRGGSCCPRRWVPPTGPGVLASSSTSGSFFSIGLFSAASLFVAGEAAPPALRLPRPLPPRPPPPAAAAPASARLPPPPLVPPPATDPSAAVLASSRAWAAAPRFSAARRRTTRAGPP